MWIVKLRVCALLVLRIAFLNSYHKVMAKQALLNHMNNIMNLCKQWCCLASCSDNVITAIDDHK